MSRITLTEATPVATTTPIEGHPSQAMIQIITPGWGSSGYYGADVLEAAAGANVWPKGTHMYVDHPTVSENYELPERSVDRLAAVLTENARWDPSIPALVGAAHIRSSFREFLADPIMREAIGTSIRATAEVRQGEAEGRRGTIVTELVEGVSVDFVTRAGAGGKIISVMESARPVREARAQDTISALNDALREAYGSEDGWMWVRDFDPDQSIVYYTFEDAGGSGTFQHAFDQADDGSVTLTGEPVAVRIETNYVPVDPAGESGTTDESQGGTMPQTQIEESELARLRESAGRVTALEADLANATTERDAAAVERDTARRELADDRNRATASEHARARVIDQNQALDPMIVDRIVESACRAVPVNDQGGVDTAALDRLVDEARTTEETYLARVGARRSSAPLRYGAPAEESGGTADIGTLKALSTSVFGPVGTVNGVGG